ncbi:hypothetical protein N9M61_03715 [Gammaproteobacteria bacterium]|jgi:uncharacterized membrane protein YczE|nr:hypothetical protein [Gammaproteobacteria bacterium]MDA8799505.1 hypothetical protein [Gammaproteobacteria bacterium]MDC0333067.1 hypothetical protein [Gammaproteobacteria bacterium]MDC0919570.1 hypothetical protein [Gammaproteobacteria bacterium]
MKIFSIRSVPTTEWSSEKPLNFSPKPLTVIILCLGLILFGLGESLIITASAGMSPWTVLAEGLSMTTGLSIGALTFIISLVVLLLWVPLKQQAGVGTILNVIIIAAVIEWSLPYLPHPETYAIQIIQAIIGTLVVGIASGIYLIANLGPGPRDGLMTGFQKITNLPIAWVRVLLEITVISMGYALGGTIGLATIIFAFGIGPAVSLGLYLIASISKE